MPSGAVLMSDGSLMITAHSNTPSFSSANSDFMLFSSDYKGRNQCSNLNTEDINGYSEATVADAAEFVWKTATSSSYATKTLSSSLGSGESVTSSFTVASFTNIVNEICNNYNPIPPENGIPEL